MSGGTVAELVKGMHDEAARGMVDVMNRYADMVRKAATGKLTQDEAATAASIAYEMGLPADRFDRDVAVVKAERSLTTQIERDRADKSTHAERARAARARIDEFERELKLARAVPHRLHGEAIARAERLQEQARMVAANPHLFKAADTLSDNEWKAVRA